MAVTIRRAARGDSTERYHHLMKQILTRVPDALHALARQEAAARDVSLNEFVIKAIEAELAKSERPGAALKARAAAMGLMALPVSLDGSPPPPPDEVERRWREAAKTLPPDTGEVLLDILLKQREEEPW
jgi:hypothetical protein